ncbi:Hypothetical predicted protein [Paramuricea clavata]|uniref:Uncharacterized protein n=1 Tax=Paramuricea clavata TaxID=317549 RepID=A0A7D9I1L9_PARCT|nr:Hypothetical predicted protein [Paramuricea clavata]
MRVQLMEALLGLLGSVMAVTIFSFIFCVVSFIRFMENHKNNMLRMFKGDKSFIPKNISATQFMIGKGLRCHSYQIGYFLWGYILVLLLLSFTFFVIYLLSLDAVQDLVVNYMKGGGVYLIVAIFSWLSLRIITLIFRDYSYSKDVISINNRNAYMVFSYFWFFIGLPMGFFSAILRILKAMAVGALMLPRIDHSVMPDGFQRLDRGFNAYICYLHVETAYRNPVLRVFCQMLVDETQNNPRNVQTLGINRVRKWTFSAQARARWFLALTLARNPQLASDRKPDVQAPQPAQAGHARHGDVVIEIDQFCADNTALIQDK